jgi:DNA polymerase-1
MIRMPGALATAGLSSKMLLQVHDELIFEADESQVEETIRIARQTMSRATEPVLELRVPLKVDANAADDWEAAH